MNLLTDGNFRKGFHLKGLDSIRDGHGSIKEFSLTEEPPEWYLCQWNSKYNLKDGKFLSLGGGRYAIGDESKRLTIYEDGNLEFDLKASKEYACARQESEPWPHLLIEQEITQNNAVKDMTEIVCRARFKLLELKNYMGETEKEYHTVQFVWVVTLRDDNSASPSFGHFIWVVMCPLDSRYEYAPLFTRQDAALPGGEFIYSFCGSAFIDKPMASGETVEMNFDLRPRIPMILECAQKNGFMKGSKLDDLVISSTNMGFEITGTFDCRVRVENLKISCKTVNDKEKDLWENAR